MLGFSPTDPNILLNRKGKDMDLFAKTKIGNLSVQNHFIRSATYEGLATVEGYPTEKIINLYERLARGKVGTIVTSYTYITDYEQPRVNQLGIYSDEMIPAYKNLTDRVHKYDTKIFMQIVHGSSLSQGYPLKAEILGPSNMKNPDSELISRSVTKKEIQNIIQYFAHAAERVKKAGFDGVQIHCAHGYLLSQFISPIFNHRTDEYGGNCENRFRLVRQVYEAVRKTVGDEYQVWVKLNSTDEVLGGLTIEDFLYMGEKLSKAGIDAIEISGNQWKKHLPEERMYYKKEAEKLAACIDAPVILTGGLRNRSNLDEICNNSKIRFFGFARPFLTNPEFLSVLHKEYSR